MFGNKFDLLGGICSILANRDYGCGRNELQRFRIDDRNDLYLPRAGKHGKWRFSVCGRRMLVAAHNAGIKLLRDGNNELRSSMKR